MLAEAMEKQMFRAELKVAIPWWIVRRRDAAAKHVEGRETGSLKLEIKPEE